YCNLFTRPQTRRTADADNLLLSRIRGVQRMGKFIPGLIIGLLIIPIVVWCWLTLGNPPVAVSDPSFPFEKQIVHMPLNRRIDAQMPKTSPIQATPENLLAGAHIYREQCASCHGLSGHPSGFGPHMYPAAPQLWNKHRNGVVGVSDDPVGETYWKVDNGIRLTGMPSYRKTLSDTEMWQVCWLLKQADQPLPSDVQQLVQTPLPESTPNPVR
ncbi:MAG TPA: cytochrome c, partial [Acidobacteriaceae bacterium]|nr:cytochrome c [Acidobacteriaceae bacterium]